MHSFFWEQAGKRIPARTPVSVIAEVRVVIPHHWRVMLWHYLESPATGSGWVRIYKRWWFWKSILGAYIRDQALQRKCLAWDYYSKIDLKSKKLDLMTQDALCNPSFLWLAVSRAGDCAVLLTDIREVPHFMFVFCKTILTSSGVLCEIGMKSTMWKKSIIWKWVLLKKVYNESNKCFSFLPWYILLK